MNTKLVVMSALIGAALVAGLAGEADAKRRLSATRAQVSAACEANPGSTEWGTHAGATGGYGCISRAGWVVCDAGGHCEGGRVSNRDNVPDGEAGGGRAGGRSR